MLQSSCSTRLVRRVGVVGDDRADAPGTCRPRPPRPRRSRRRARRGRRRRCAPPRPPAAPCPGSRRGRSTTCRGRSTSCPSAATVSSTIAFSGNPAWSNAHAIFTYAPPRRSRPAGSAPVSSAYSCAAISAAPSTPARGPWRAIRIVVFRPSPGTTWRNAASRAGSSSSSPARETPPPITTSSGSKVLIALAIPIPIRSPSTRRHHSDGVVAGLGAGDHVVAVDVALLGEHLARGRSRGTGSRRSRPAGPARARRPASPATRAAGTGRPARCCRTSRSRPMIVCPTSAADVVAPR